MISWLVTAAKAATSFNDRGNGLIKTAPANPLSQRCRQPQATLLCHTGILYPSSHTLSDTKKSQALNGPDSTLDLELESYFERCHSNILSPSPESDRETTENERPPVLMDTLMDKITPKDKRTEQVLRYDTMVAGRLGGRPVSAFADFGAATDLMSMEYVRRQGHQVNKTQPGRVRLAGARSVRSEGTVTLPWQFDGELSAFNRTFTVLSSCLHDVVLGSHFIQLTSLFSKYKDRVIRKLRSVHLPRFCATDNPLYRMQGSVDGYSVLALPDTGSDFLLISRSCAKRSYLPIKTGREYEKYFQYADGSYGSTKGLVEDVAWTYPHGTTYIRDFYVLDDMPCDVILSEEFLRESQAFEKHGVLSIEAVETVDDVSLVREVGGWLYDVFTHRFTGHQSDPLTEDAVATWVHEERQELNRRDFEEQRIERLPEEQRQAAREANEACSHEWLQNNPRPEVRPPRLHGSSQQSEVGFAVG